MRHNYIERDTRQIKAEQFYGDRAVQILYAGIRERSSWLFRKLTGARISGILAYMNCDGILSEKLKNYFEIHKQLNIDSRECLDDLSDLTSLRSIFERKIRYWECRPMPNDPGAVVSPADARMLLGSFREESNLFIKGKFFDYAEMLGADKHRWLKSFEGGDFAVFRLTPEKYHYNHTPVSGKIIDFYQIQGGYHSCNPHAVVSVVTPYSKNKRVVTVIDTDVPGGTKVGLVAMIEVAALMIGDIVQCYSEKKYDNPLPIGTGIFVNRGFPKSLFRPGSSTTVLIFSKDRVRFADDIAANMYFPEAESIFSRRFGQSLIETDVKVRSFIASSLNNPGLSDYNTKH